MKNILIAVSGTGGHVYPGIALAYELKVAKINPIFIVNNNKNGVSLKIVKNSGYNYKILNFKAPQRKLSLSLFLFPFKFIKVLFDSYSIIKQTNPCVVVGMGAYLSFPIILVAKLKNIPTLIHEQNTIPGLANKILSRFVDKIAISFKESIKFFPKHKTIYTSNPIRKDIFNITRIQASTKLNLNPLVFTIFVFGGSLGATKLNNIMFNVAQKLYSKYKSNIQFIHIIGSKDFKEISKKYDNIKYNKYIVEYMDDIGNAYSCSDVVICRAGAGTVKEIEMYNLPALFVPFPYATANHQYYNAKSVEQKNLRIVIEEKNLTEEQILNFIETKINNTVIDVNRKIKPKVFPQELLAQEVSKLING